jgi:mono/diheme cytochrome c family protein
MDAMRYLISILLVLLLVTIGFYAWANRYSEIAAIKPIAPSAFDKTTIDKGASLVAIGDCAFCHTKPGGKSFAGGRKLDTPFGAIFSTNITPETSTGIGTWSLLAFTRALREGVDRSGNYLYPAFPYDHFTKIKDDDIAAIYAYLMTRPPVTAPRSENALSFPFNMRTLVAGWNLLFLRAGAYTPDPSHDDQWNRGAYLVQGLGHCGACHTPRNIFGAERRSSARYAGETLEGWHAPALNAASPAAVPWTANAIVNFLLDGWDGDHGVAAGAMTAVVDSLGTLSEDDADAIATYVLSFQDQSQAAERTKAAKSFAQKVAFGPSPSVQTTPDTAEERGEAIFVRICANCHRSGARSAPLALSSTVSGPDPHNLIRIIDKGIQPPQNALDRSMPAFGGGLSNRELADLVTFVRSHFSRKPAWSNVVDLVAEMRPSRR